MFTRTGNQAGGKEWGGEKGGVVRIIRPDDENENVGNAEGERKCGWEWEEDHREWDE